MKIQTIISTATTVLLLAACASDPRNAHQMDFDDALSFNDRSSEKLAIAAVRLAGLSEGQIREELIAALTDVTAIVKQRGHGIYVEYTAPDGRLYMWYPGNYGLVTGTWGISESFSPPRACFKYQAAYHGVTGEFEPNECVSAAQTLSEAYVVEKRSGDVFELSSKGIPYAKSAGNLPPWPEDWGDF